MTRAALQTFCHLFIVALGAGSTAQASTPTPTLDSVRRQSEQVLTLIAGLAAPTATTDVEQGSLGANLMHYAANVGANPQRFESFTEAARRILAGGKTEKRAPDVTALELDAAASKLLADVGALARAGGRRSPQVEATLVTLRARGLLGRFHARRAVPAVRFNLFKRGLQLAELVAATYAEREVVAAWRDLVAQSPTHPRIVEWRAELKRLEAGLKDLEEQCCPPDEKLLKEAVWQPAGVPAKSAP